MSGCPKCGSEIKHTEDIDADIAGNRCYCEVCGWSEYDGY